MPIDDRTEWLEADGLGGFASATTSGVRTRRYHALLLTAMTPPTGRVVLVNGFDAWVDTPSGSFALVDAALCAGRPPSRTGRSRDRSSPMIPGRPGNTRWLMARASLQEIFVQHGTERRGHRLDADREPTGPVVLRARPFLSGRDYHSMHHQNGAFRFDADRQGRRSHVSTL